MNRSLRIVVADDEPHTCEYFRTILDPLGHEVVATASNGRELVEQCRQHHPDLVISDIKMPLMDGIQAAGEIYHDRPVPVILVSAFHDPQFIEQAEGDHILAYLVKPVKEADVEMAVTVAMRRFEQFQALHKEAADAKQALQDRKLIERAKGILMRRGRLDEQEAFTRLQKLARSKSRKLVEVAEMIITAEEALET